MFTKLGIIMVLTGILLAILMVYSCFIYTTLTIWHAVYWIWLGIYIWNPSNIFYNE